jgi:dihydroorotate dehydrogenase electron transfer subunit
LASSSRATIFVEDAAVIAVLRYAGEQFVLRLQAPRTAAHASAGSFVHIRCNDTIPMRRPLSIMRADAAAGCIDVLFKVVGEGLRALGERQVGDSVGIMGPIGRGFTPSPLRPNTLLIGGGVGIPPMIFLAETLHKDSGNWSPLVLMGSELPFPFDERRSSIGCDWLPASIDRAMPLLEEWNIPSRLASLSRFDGCLHGYVTELAVRWLAGRTPEQLQQTEIFACGPTPMLQAVAALAKQYGLPCQVSLEEYMACAVGGCAGCTVLVQEDSGPAMKRVCVDGPVFDAARVFSR